MSSITDESSVMNIAEPAEDSVDPAGVDGEEEELEVPQQFCVSDEQSANWLIRKIVEVRAYAQRCSAWCEREKARAQATEQRLMFLFGHQLQNWAQQQIEQAGNRRRSISLPAGTAGFRRAPARLLIDDEQAVIHWAKSHCPQAVQVIERLGKSILNDHLKQTGELPDVGAHMEPERDSFFIK